MHHHIVWGSSGRHSSYRLVNVLFLPSQQAGSCRLNFIMVSFLDVLVLISEEVPEFLEVEPAEIGAFIFVSKQLLFVADEYLLMVLGSHVDSLRY